MLISGGIRNRGGKVSSRGFDTLPRFGQKIVKMHTLVTTTALNIITLFKTKENARRLVFKSLVGDYGPT